MSEKALIVKKQAEVSMATRYGEFTVLAFASNSEERMPHMVLVNPKTDFSGLVNVRIHSECMTGDIFHSYRCECGEQLDYSLNYIKEQTGVVIYLRQEGRGIGIISKLHAYSKQDEGFDTAQANKELGFGYDERTYEDATIILSELGASEIALLTNNPDKISAFDNSKIKVVERISIEIEPRKENISYLETKKNFFGHKLNNI